MDILEILNKIGYSDIRDFGKEYRCKPLYRSSGNPNSLCIQKSSGKWYDFGTSMGGELSQLVEITLKVSPFEASEYIGSNNIHIAKHNIELKEVKKFDKNILLKLVKNHDYWLKRDISKETIENFEGGIATSGRMIYRYVFPIFNEKDELVGFTGRLLKEYGDLPKWKIIGQKSNWCYPFKYNSTEILKQKSVVLVESIGDMLNLWDAGIKNSLVVFGVEVSSKIIELLLKLDIQKINIAFNNDVGNNLIGNIAAEQAANKLKKFFDDEQINVAIPEAKDFGEMDKEQIKLWQKTHL